MEEQTRETCLQSCFTCQHRIFDEQWGEYKCMFYEHRLYDYDRYTDCRAYKKKGDRTNDQIGN